MMEFSNMSNDQLWNVNESLLTTWSDGPVPDRVRLLKLDTQHEKAVSISTLEELVKDHPNEPYLFLRLAAVYTEFYDFKPARALCQKAQQIILPKTDVKLEDWLRKLDLSIEMNSKHQDQTYKKLLDLCEDANSDPWSNPEPRPFSLYSLTDDRSDGFSTDALRDAIARITDGKVENDVFVKFYERYLAIQSSELEDVFRLGEGSLKPLVQFGFFYSRVHCISDSSRMKTSDAIVNHLKKMQEALQSAFLFSKNDGEISIEFIHALHAKVVGDDRVQRRGQSLIVTPVNKFRDITVYCAETKTLFPHHERVPDLMERFMRVWSSLLSLSRKTASMDPFDVAAWIHLSFSTIHPYVDGNGRVARLLSSIPLMEADLPPICVRHTSTREYYAAIQKSRDATDLKYLSDFLRTEMLDSLQAVYELFFSKT